MSSVTVFKGQGIDAVFCGSGAVGGNTGGEQEPQALTQTHGTARNGNEQ